MDFRFYTIDEVAELLRVHRNTVYRWCRSGRLPGAKVGKDWRIPAEALEELRGASQLLGGGRGESPPGPADPTVADAAAAAPADPAGAHPAAAGASGAGLEDAFDRLVIGDHVMGIVPSVDAVFDFEIRFLKSGLARGERLLKGCWWQSIAEYRERAEAAGVDIGRLEHEGRLEIVQLHPVCQRGGPEEAGRAWGRAVGRARELGYPGLWGSGSPDLECCYDQAGLLAFEREMDRVLQGEPVVAVCVYAQTQGPGHYARLLEVAARAHNRLLLADGERAVLTAAPQAA